MAVFDIKKAKRDGIAAGLFFCINIGIWLLPCASWVRYVVSAVIVAEYSGIFHKKQIGKAVFTMLAFYNFHCLCFLIANSIYMKMTNVWMKSIDGLQDDYEQQVYHSMAAGLSVTVFFYTVLFVVMVVIFCRLVKSVGIMTWQDVVMLSVLNFVGSMIASMVNSLLVVKIGTGVFILFDEKLDLLWKVPMIAVFIFAGETALVYFWQKYRVLFAKRQKHFVEEQQVKAMKQRLEEAENFYGSIRKVRHEMKNHMANIKGLAETGQYGEIDEYIQRMDASMQEENSLSHTTKQSVHLEIVTEHGIGLKNVHDMAERYYGGVKIKVKKDIFHVTVMLQQREVKENK